MAFEFTPTDIEDVRLVDTAVYEDERGHLFESFERQAFADNGLFEDIALEFQSNSTRNVLRGLHYQREPFAQAKLVRCIIGEIYDVAVDIRPDSPHFGEYVGHRLSEENKRALYVPTGFAHGFLTLSVNAVVDYKVDNEYAPDYEAGIIWNDPAVDIDWPTDSPPVLSEKDRQWPTLAEIEADIEFGMAEQ